MILHKDGELTTRAMIETAEREILQVSNSSGLGSKRNAKAKTQRRNTDRY